MTDDCIYNLQALQCTAMQLRTEQDITMNQEGWSTFMKLCLATHNEKMLNSLLELFLTSEEKDSLALRCLIVLDLLKQEKTQRVIAEDLQVSIAKITRGSNELKRMPAELIHFLKEQISE